jgi:ribosomal protein S27AE
MLCTVAAAALLSSPACMHRLTSECDRCGESVMILTHL